MRVKLKDVCAFYTGTGFPKKYQGQLSGTYPFYKVGDIANNVVSGKVYLEQCNNYISEETLELIKGSIIPKNTIVFAKIGEALKLNRRAITSTDCLIDNNAMGIAAKSDKLRTLFFYYFMRNIKMELLAESTTVPSVRKSRLEAYEIDIPSLDEQKIIEGKLTILSKVIHLKEKQLLKLDELVKARFVEMFGDPIENTYSFPILKLGELSELITKGASPSWQGYSYTEDSTQTLFVTSENVREGYMDFSSIKYVEDAFNEKQKRSMIQKGDYLINIVGASIGRAAQFNMDCKANMNQAAALVRIKDNTISDNYLLYYLNSDKAQMMYNSMKSDTGRANLSLQDIANLEILVPDLTLQVKFASFVEEIDKSRLLSNHSLYLKIHKLLTIKKAALAANDYYLTYLLVL